MYFPLLKPHGQGKRSAAQPKAIDSEVPSVMSDGCIILYRAKVVKCYFAFSGTFGEMNSLHCTSPRLHWQSITKSALSFCRVIAKQ